MSIREFREWAFSGDMKSATTGWSQLLLVFALLAFLSGCYGLPSDTPATIPGTPPPFSCTNFLESRWREFRFGVDSPDDVALTASRQWGVDKEQLTPYEMTHGLSRFGWSDNNREIFYTALFRKKQLQKFEVRFDPPPTLAQVLGCLGPPEYYASYEETDIEKFGFDLSLWYLEKGIVVQHVSFYSLVSPTADLPAQRMENLFVVAPGTLEQMVPNVYTMGFLPSVQAWGLCILRPWPGLIEAIEIESFLDEEDRRCKSS